MYRILQIDHTEKEKSLEDILNQMESGGYELVQIIDGFQMTLIFRFVKPVKKDPKK